MFAEEPVEKTKEESTQQVEVTKVNTKPKVNMRQIIIAIVAAVVIISTVFGVKKVQEQKAIKAAQASTEYGENIETLTTLMMVGAADAETCGNLIKRVWHNSVYQERDTETDQYTRTDGYFVSDYNTALANLFNNKSFSSTINGIKSNRDSVSSIMKDLKNPPAEWENAYKDLQGFYDSYVKLTDLATNPTGSLQTFTDDFNDADLDVSNAYDKLELNFD